MKKIGFYLIVIIQIFFIAMIGWQYMLIDQFGETAELRISKKDDRYGSYSNQDVAHVQYDINRIPQDLWENDMKELSYNERVYVLLEQNEEGYLTVEKASGNKLQATGGQFVFPAKFMHESHRNGEVEYGIETIRKAIVDGYETGQPSSAVVKIAPWGQKKIVELRQKE